MKFSTLILQLVICAFLMGCGAFKSQSFKKFACVGSACGLEVTPPAAPSPVPTPAPSPNPDPTPTPNPPADSSGTLPSNPLLPSGPVVELDTVTDEVHVTLPLGPFNPWPGSSLTEIFAGHPEIQITTVTGPNGSSWLDVTFPRTLLDDGISAAPGRLPNGDTLPGVPNGELPMLSTTLPGSHPLYLYLGLRRFAFFLPLNLSTPFPIRFVIWNKKNTQELGEIWLLPKKNGHRGGLYLVFFIPDDWLNIH